MGEKHPNPHFCPHGKKASGGAPAPTCGINISLSPQNSALSLPTNLNEGIYVTNNYNVSKLSDFTLVNFVTKDMDLGINFGFNRELYYLITADNLKYYEVNMALDSAGNKLISKENILYDIAGNQVTINVNGETYIVMYKYMSESYEVPDGEKYHLCDNQ